MSMLLLSAMKKKGIVRNGLKVWLEGKDFTNSPPTSLLRDRSGNGNNATPSGMDYTSLSGSDGNGGIVFDGVDDYCGIVDSESLNFGSGDFTIEVFVKLRALNKVQYFVAQGTSSASSTSFYYRISDVNKIVVGVCSASTYYESISSSSLTDTTNYNQIIMSREGNFLKAYVNNIEYASLNIGSITINNVSTPLNIGTSGSAISGHISGSIKKCRVYKGKALTNAERKQNYNASK